MAAQIAASMGIRIDVTKEVPKRNDGNVKAKLPFFLKTIFQLGDVFFIDPKADCITDYESFLSVCLMSRGCHNCTLYIKKNRKR